MDIMPHIDRFDVDMEEPFRAKVYALENKNRAHNVHHVEPEFNRLVTFNSSRWHGCHPINEGWRFQFVTNLWREKPKDAPPPESPEQMRKRRTKKLEKAYKRYKPGDTTIIESFGENKLVDMLQDLELWKNCAKKGRQWMDWGAKAENRFQMATKLVFQLHPEVTAIKNPGGTIAGFEYWCTTMSDYDEHERDGKGIPFHIETDEAKVSHPILGAHYFGYKHDDRIGVVGGLLRIITPHDPSMVTTSEEAETYADKYGKKGKGRMEHVNPDFNRLVVFNATKWHTVTEVDRGDYAALMVNLWKEKPKTMQDLKVSSYSYGDSDDEEEEDSSLQHDEL